MRTPGALLASTAVLAILCSACTVTTPGSPQPIGDPSTPAAPSRKVFKASAVEKGVTSVLRDDYKVAGVGSVVCPEDQPVKVGLAFNCEVDVGGESMTVKITVKTTDGEFEVGQPS
jgi:hypothetical protein